MNVGDGHPIKTTQTTRPLHENQQADNEVEDVKEATKDNTAVSKEYVVSFIIRLVYSLHGKTYVVKCCRYGPRNNNFQSPYHIHVFFIR